MLNNAFEICFPKFFENSFVEGEGSKTCIGYTLDIHEKSTCMTLWSGGGYSEYLPKALYTPSLGQECTAPEVGIHCIPQQGTVLMFYFTQITGKLPSLFFRNYILG